MSPFLVAELSCNHLQDERRAHAIVDAAADAGADGFKVQVWEPGTMCLDHSIVLDTGPWKGCSLVSLYEQAHTPWGWLPSLFRHCRDRGMEPFGAAFDVASVDYLCDLGVQRLKVASFELTDLPLIRYMASKGKPMILSTGMATLKEIAAAVIAAEQTPGCHADATGWLDLTLLKCTSAYPADASHANLATFFSEPYLMRGVERNRGAWQIHRDKFGLSDHSVGLGVAVAAAALGATYIEKHLTLERAHGGPDAGFSMEPAEFKQLVAECRRAAAAIGTVKYGPGPNESPELRRSLWVCKDIAAGEPLRLGDNVRTARPALGMPCDTPLEGKTARRALRAGSPLQADAIGG